MSFWLCPVKYASWWIIKREQVFGAPSFAAEKMNKVKLGDILVICLIGSKKGIKAICQTTSEVFFDNSNVWGKNRYPLRLNIKVLKEFPVIPINEFYGGSISENLVVEPFLKGVWITKMDKLQFEKIKKKTNFS